MSFEVKGKLIFIGEVQTRQGRNGEWRKREFVIETQDAYPKQICFLLWNDKVDLLDSCELNDLVQVRFQVASREYNGRWYTDATAYALQRRSLQEQDYVPAAEQEDYPTGAAFTDDSEEELPF
ncbi:DUF3127 domain-containing protein [Thermonema rossianum]|uniref:DUF3127 domain-containing protein n=1 Tax=Thermonema rossianum TaxID=55505 RepID=UPI00057172E6|nr:DUF3127 domain-containing protein [Thermonema rossianum]